MDIEKAKELYQQTPKESSPTLLDKILLFYILQEVNKSLELALKAKDTYCSLSYYQPSDRFVRCLGFARMHYKEKGFKVKLATRRSERIDGSKYYAFAEVTISGWEK